MSLKGDGLCAGAVALAANPDAHIFFTHPFGLMEDLNEAEDEDTVIICDTALSESHLPQLLERFSTIARKGTLIYLDHHPLPETVSSCQPSIIISPFGPYRGDS